MASVENRPLTDSRIISLAQYQVGLATGFADSRMSRERQVVMEYRDGLLPKRSHKGDVEYTSRDVYEAVEDLKSNLLEVFSGNRRPVTFVPTLNETEDAARARTDYTHDVVFRQNRGTSIVRDVIDNGLTGRSGVCKVYWCDDVKEETYHLENVSEPELQALMVKHPDATIEDYTLSEDGVTIEKFSYSIKINRSKPHIYVIPPEEFLISPQAESIEEAVFVGHRKEVTYGELVAEGYTKKQLEDIQSNDALWLTLSPERILRFQQTDDTISWSPEDDGQKATRVCQRIEAYLRLDMKGDGNLQLYKVVYVGNTLLHKERVDRKPFVAFTPLPRPNAFWGHNYCLLVKDVQIAKTYLVRSILNHAMVTNNPRLMIQKGAVMNPREVTENRIGGIINVTRLDGIAPLPQAGLNPFVFQTLSMLDEARQSRTGISDLARGLNPDAISKQNSASMVGQLITVSETRNKAVAKNFAENFLRDLYSEVYRLILENVSEDQINSTVTGWQPIDFTQWPEDTEMEVSYHLGYGADNEAIQKWIAFHTLVSNIPDLAANYGPAQKYQVIRQASLDGGLTRNLDRFLLPPDKAPQPPPNPMMQAELAVKQAEAQQKQAQAQQTSASIGQDQQSNNIELMKARLEIEKMQADIALEKAKLQLDQAQVRFEAEKLDLQRQKLELQAHTAAENARLKQDMLAHKVLVDAAEVSLQKEAQEQAKLTAVAAPTRN